MVRFYPLPPVSYATACVTLKSHTSAWCVTVCHSEQYQKTYSYHYKVPFLSPGGGLLRANPPQTKFQAPSNWNNKHYKSGVFVKILDVKPPCTYVKTLTEDFLTTVLQSSVEDRKKLLFISEARAWQIAPDIFPFFRNSISPTFNPRQCGKDSCHPPSTFDTTTSYNFFLVTVN